MSISIKVFNATHYMFAHKHQMVPISEIMVYAYINFNSTFHPQLEKKEKSLILLHFLYFIAFPFPKDYKSLFGKIINHFLCRPLIAIINFLLILHILLPSRLLNIR